MQLGLFLKASTFPLTESQRVEMGRQFPRHPKSQTPSPNASSELHNEAHKADAVVLSDRESACLWRRP